MVGSQGRLPEEETWRRLMRAVHGHSIHQAEVLACSSGPRRLSHPLLTEVPAQRRKHLCEGPCRATVGKKWLL